MTNSSEDIVGLIAAYSATPARLREAVDALDTAALDRPVGENEWTPRQIILHLVDADLVAAMRIRQILAEERPTLPGFDQEAWAAMLGYASADAAAVADALALFAMLRSSTALLLRRAPRQRWEAWGQHSERGRQTLRDVVTTYTRHGEDHLAQLRQQNAMI